MPARASRTTFVGRERELATLLERLDAAGQGAGGVVLVAGEPGIGKTRLLSEFAAIARACGWQVLGGRAYETEGMPPYLPFIEALRGHLGAVPDEALQPQLPRDVSVIVLLLPELRDRLPGLPEASALNPEDARYRLFEAVSALLLAIAGPLPNPRPPSIVGKGENDHRSPWPPSRQWKGETRRETTRHASPRAFRHPTADTRHPRACC